MGRSACPASAGVPALRASPPAYGMHVTADARDARHRRRARSLPAYEMYFTSQSEIDGKNSSSSVRSVSLTRKGITPR
ncbi:hypothetical protein GCM10028813_47070 [Ramlibacter alkalitolerans]